ncbi:MAG: hypothetical protein ACSLEW_04320 [Nocardioides sp.]
MTVLWFLITTLVGGTVIGLLGKFFAPDGKDNIPFGAVIVCGIGGMLIGSFLYYGLFGVADNVSGLKDYGWDNTTKGIDWWRHLWQIATAALLVSAASYVTGRPRAVR